jgi:hypothetical protein
MRVNIKYLLGFYRGDFQLVKIYPARPGELSVWYIRA